MISNALSLVYRRLWRLLYRVWRASSGTTPDRIRWLSIWRYEKVNVRYSQSFLGLVDGELIGLSVFFSQYSHKHAYEHRRIWRIWM